MNNQCLYSMHKNLEVHKISCDLGRPDNLRLSCLHSLADGDTVYVTLYNQDDNTDGIDTYQFVCVVKNTVIILKKIIK